MIEPLSIAILEIDEFVAVVAERGRPYGDQLLEQVLRCMGAAPGRGDSEVSRQLALRE